jgi:hypothetical protein
MKNSYIVSFAPGSSGRFVKFILYSLLTDYKKEMMITDENSAHLENFYAGAKQAHMLDLGFGKKKDFNTGESDSIFTLFEFDSDTPIGVPKIFYTHQYPDFELIQKNLPDTKIILINIESEKDVWYEIIGNNIYKNWISVLNRRDVGMQLIPYEIKFIEWLTKLYLKVLGIDLNLPFKYDINNIEKLVYAVHELWEESKIQNIALPSFINHIVDFKKYPNLTVINYKELYTKTSTENYIALEKLEKLTNTVANYQTLNNYEKYVMGRKKFVQTSMPWIAGNCVEKPNN